MSLCLCVSVSLSLCFYVCLAFKVLLFVVTLVPLLFLIGYSFLAHLCPDACCLCVFFSLEKSHWHLAADQRSVGKDVSPHACAMPEPLLLALLCLPCLLFTGKLASESSFTVLPSRGATCHVSPRVPSDRASSPLLGLPLPHPCPPVTPCKHTQKFTSLHSQQNFGQSADVWPPNSRCIEKCHHVIRVQ